MTCDALSELLNELTKDIRVWTEVDFIGRSTQVAEHELLDEETLGLERLELAFITHTIKQRIANDCDASATF